MAVLGRVIETEPLSSEERRRHALAILCAAVLHLLLFQAFMFSRPVTLEPPHKAEPSEDVIAVSLITLPPVPQAPEVLPEPIEALPEMMDAPLPPPPSAKPRSQMAPPSEPAIEPAAPDILASSRPATMADSGNVVPLPQNGSPASFEKIANEHRIDEGLKAMAAELSCLKGFSQECAETRKDVFEEFQMTETEKVYTKKYAHTGMSAEFYGMSERQIRAKLNVPNAGENGIYIPFTNIGIDGGWLDAMHGVNKGCEWKAGIDKAGNHAPIKDCPDFLPAAKEDRDRRNRFQARFEAKEARRKDESQP